MRTMIAVSICSLLIACGGKTSDTSPRHSGDAKDAVDDDDDSDGDSVATSVPEADEPVPPGLKESEPLVCTGSESISVESVYIRTDGDGVTVRGPCTITIRNSTIVAGRYGLLLQGSGNIIIESSKVRGVMGAAAIPGMGYVKARGTHFKGYISRTGGGDISDRGGNTFE